MQREIKSRGMTAGSLYKVLLIGHTFSIGLLLVFMGVFSLFGYETVHIEGVPAVGLKGLLTSILAAGLFAVVFSSINWLFVLTGNWVFTRFRPYQLVIHEVDTAENI